MSSKETDDSKSTDGLLKDDLSVTVEGFVDEIPVGPEVVAKTFCSLVAVGAVVGLFVGSDVISATEGASVGSEVGDLVLDASVGGFSAV